MFLLQLLMSYGEDFKEENKETRNSNLFDLFRFNCECQACHENWPTSRFIPIRLTSLYVKIYYHFEIALLIFLIILPEIF